MADACVFLMNLSDERYNALLGNDEIVTGCFEPPPVNIGVNDDVTIAELAGLTGRVAGALGYIICNSSKPDGTPRKQLGVRRIQRAGWRATTALQNGLRTACAEFMRQ